LTNDRTINVLQLTLKTKAGVPANIENRLKTMTENERDHILAALEKCDWKIRGKGGAAELLDINASTLYSRMRKLNIEIRVAPKNTDL
jgi:two-component system response regulator HydG